MNLPQPLPVVVINGPTASGKSSLAVDLALHAIGEGQPAEVVNCDSMLVYRGMDIGTAKPSMAERRGIVHHLIDIADVTETASVAEFQTLARGRIADCRSRGVLPILVGGSALYVRAILDVFEFPGTDPQVRARYEQRCAEIGPEALHAELAARAPEAAAGILPGNGRRIVRALEVLEITGTFTPTIPEPTYALADVVQVGLELSREELDARIERRVDLMLEQGLVEEVSVLLQHGLREGMTASRAIGYRQFIAAIDGECSLAEARERTIAATRRFSRKQLAWFRRDPRVVWSPAGDVGNVAAIWSLLLDQGE